MRVTFVVEDSLREPDALLRRTPVAIRSSDQLLVKAIVSILRRPWNSAREFRSYVGEIVACVACDRREIRNPFCLRPA